MSSLHQFLSRVVSLPRVQQQRRSLFLPGVLTFALLLVVTLLLRPHAEYLRLSDFLPRSISFLLEDPEGQRIDPVMPALLLLPVLLVVVGWALRRLAPPTFTVSTTSANAAAHFKRGLGPLFTGILLLALLVWLQSDPVAPATSHEVQFALLVGGVALLVWGVGAAPRLSLPRAAGFWHPLTAIMLLALIVRVVGLDSTVRTFIDEVLTATPTIRLVHNPDTRILHQMGQLMPYPYPYAVWQHWATELFGRNLVGLRLTSAVIGTLTVGSTYLMVRTLFNRRLALITAVVLATFPLHVHFSRIAVINITDLLVATLSVAFLGRGLRGGRPLDYAVGGAALGMSQYFYEGGKIFTPLLIVTWLLGVFILCGQRLNAAARRGLIAAAATAVLTAAPLYLTYAALDSPFESRLYGDTMRALHEFNYFVGDNFQQHSQWLLSAALVYVHEPEVSLFYAGKRPFVLLPLVPVFLLGLAATVWRWRSPGTLLVGLWFGALVLANSVLVEYNGAARHMLNIPALVTIIALGLDLALKLAQRTVTRAFAGAGWLDWLDRQRGRLLAVLLVALTAGHIIYYFAVHLPIYNVQIRTPHSPPKPDVYDPLFRSLDFPPDTDVYIISREHNVTEGHINGSLAYFSDDIRFSYVAPDDIDADWLRELPHDHDLAFFVLATDLLTPRLLRDHVAIAPAQAAPHAYDGVPLGVGYVLYYARGQNTPE